MEYQERTIQRVFSIRFASGDHIIENLEKLIKEKNIRAGTVILLGAFSKGNLVLGFRRFSRAPKDLNRTSFNDTQEVVGVGNISWMNDKPKVHLQAGVGKEREVFIAHVVEADVTGAEAVILEFSGPEFTGSVLV